MISKYLIEKEGVIPFYIDHKRRVDAKISDTGIPILVQFGEKKPQVVVIDVVDLQKQAEALGCPLKPLPGNMSSNKLVEIFRIRCDLFSRPHEWPPQIEERRWIMYSPKLLGRGQHKTVRLGMLIDPSEWNPRESFCATFIPNKGHEREFFREIRFLQKARTCPHIFNPPKAYTWNGITRYIGDAYNCNAYTGFRKGSPCKFDDEIRLSVVEQIAKGLEYLHKNRILHNDLKPSNILLRNLKGRDVKAVLCDFGLSFQLQHLKERKPWNTTIFIMPPEGYNSLASDLWALGITVRMIYTGSPPWYKGLDNEKFKTWIRGISQKQWNQHPLNKCISEKGVNQYRNALQDVMKITLIINPELRATTEHIVQQLSWKTNLNNPELFE